MLFFIFNYSKRDAQLQNCRGNFMGDHCELCMDGYFMDPYDGQCKMCPCRQEGLKCTVDNFNNPNCDECPEGYTGSLCNLLVYLKAT